MLPAYHFTVLESIGTATSIAVYAAKGCTLPPAPPVAPCELVENYEYKGVVVSTLLGRNVSGCCVACCKGTHCVGFARKVGGQP